MAKALARKITACMIVLILVSVVSGPNSGAGARGLAITQDADQPEPQAAESQEMLPPPEPRVKISQPAPFLGVKPISSQSAVAPHMPTPGLEQEDDAPVVASGKSEQSDIALEGLPNLIPFDLNGYWSGPVVLSGLANASQSGSLTAGVEFYLNMAALNEGPGDIEDGQPFSVVVTIDGTQVYSDTWEWGLYSYYYIYQTNYRVTRAISEGWHTVSFSVDSNAEISEGDESDNTWSDTLYWASADRANLTAYTPDGWDYPVQVTSTQGYTGDPRLYSDKISYLHFAYINEGVTTANQFNVSVTLDGIPLVSFTDDLSPGEYGYTLGFEIPANTIAHGWHTLQLNLDEGAIIDEYNEEDNTWEADFYWEASGKPNLYPYQPNTWEDALIASSVTGGHTFDVLTEGQPIYVDWAVINGGWGDVPASAKFRVQLICDANVLTYWEWPYVLASGFYIYVDDYPLTLSAGWHYLSIVADSSNSVAETGELDNITGVWIYVSQPDGQPEIRVEPQAITVDIASDASASPARPETLQRSMSLVLPVDPDEHGLGAEITPPTRYILPRAPLLSSSQANNLSLPAAVDHTSKLPPVGNQGNAGSCVGWATSYYYKSYQEGLDHGWDLTETGHQFSPNFVWNQIQPTSSCGGTWPGDAFALMTEKGDLTLSDMPYSEDCKTQPTNEQLDTAASYRAENYGMFFDYNNPPDDTVITQMKEWLAGGDIIQLSLPVTPEFDSPSGPYCLIDLPNQGESRGGHAITLVGYDDNIGGLGKQGFKMVNSWGTGWGCSGFAYLTYDWIQANAWEAWWMRDIRTGSNTFRDFTIHNDGSGILTVSAVGKQGQSAWLNVSLPQALPLLIEPGESRTVQLSFNPQDLNAGTFTETVIVTSDDADEPQSQVTVTLNNGVSGAPIPQSASSPLPANEALSQNAFDLRLNWNGDESAAVMYDVRLDTANPPVEVVCNDLSANGCVVPDLRPNTTYYWRVISLNNMFSTPGPVWSFTTGAGSMVFIPNILHR